MKRKILSLLSVLLVATLLTSPVSAGGGVGFSRVQFSLGSLIATGYVSGIGNTDVTVLLEAIGLPVVTCTNQSGNQSPGQNPPKVSASGQQFLPGNSDQQTKNGKTQFSGVETQDPETLPWDVAGCPNSNWTAHIDFILWTNATISVRDTATNGLLLEQNYTCTTTRDPDSVSCTAVP